MSICGRGRALVYQTCPGGYVDILVAGRAIGTQGDDGAYQSPQILLVQGSPLPRWDSEM
jgi:hypothetical protein